MKLQIVIPALNEEKSIESIIKRCLDIKSYIIKSSPVTIVDVTVVSDGSTDNTVRIANQYRNEINLIVFEKNRGYGAAIKEGWKQSNADLLGFIDADGTCDPAFFADLCNILIEKNADVALGSRLNKNSKMPFIRRFGNSIYSFILSFVSFKKINDTASGMRVVRASSLPQILPLPDGLHFTPAMSARTILNNDLIICEKDMAYNEREGQSKLKVFRDGIRFLNIIFKMIFLYQPYKIFSLIAITLFIFVLSLMAYPIYYYLNHQEVLEWMIYRFITAEIAGITGYLLLSASFISKRIINISLYKGGRKNYTNILNLENIFRPKFMFSISLIFIVIATSLIYRSVFNRITTGVTYEHWSRYVASSFFYILAFISLVTVAVDYVIGLIDERLRYLEDDRLQ